MLPGGRDVTLRTEDGLDLAAWYVPAASGASAARRSWWPAATRGIEAIVRRLAQALRAAGFGVLLLDYRGYGGNPGSPSEQGLALDVRAAYRFLTADEAITDG